MHELEQDHLLLFKLCLSCLCSFFVHEVVKVNEFSQELFLFKKLLIFSLGDAMWIAIHELQLRVRNLGGNVGCWYGSLYFSLTERKSLVLPLLQGKKAYKSFRWQKAWLSGISEKHACFTCVICLASKAQWVFSGTSLIQEILDFCSYGCKDKNTGVVALRVTGIVAHSSPQEGAYRSFKWQKTLIFWNLLNCFH